jgi:hypothetical protein
MENKMKSAYFYSAFIGLALSLSMQSFAQSTDDTGLFEGDSDVVLKGHLQWEYEDTGSEGGRNGDSTFDSQYLTMWFGYHVEENMRVVAEVEYEHGGTINQTGGANGGGGGELEVDQGFVEWELQKALIIKIGKFYTPFGIERFSYAGPSNRLVSRPGTFQNVYPGTYAEVGVNLGGQLPIVGSTTFNYEVAVVNGLGDTANTSIRDARQSRDNNDNKAMVGRISVNAKPDDADIEFGASYYDGKFNSHQGYIADNRLRLTYAGIDLRVKYKNFDFIAEQIISTVEQGETLINGKRNFRRSGYYAQLAYRSEVDREYVKFIDVVARFNSKDENSTVQNTADQNQMALGINWGLYKKVILKLEYQFNHERHGNKLSDNAWLGQVSVAF